MKSAVTVDDYDAMGAEYHLGGTTAAVDTNPVCVVGMGKLT